MHKVIYYLQLYYISKWLHSTHIFSGYTFLSPLNRFVWLRFYTQFENFPLICKASPLPVKGFKFGPIRGTHGLPHLLSHGTSVYNDLVQGPVTLIPVAEHLAVELSLPAFMTFRMPDKALSYCATVAVFVQSMFNNLNKLVLI